MKRGSRVEKTQNFKEKKLVVGSNILYFSINLYYLGNISRKCARDEDDLLHIKWSKTMCACAVSDFPFFNSVSVQVCLILSSSA